MKHLDKNSLYHVIVNILISIWSTEAAVGASCCKEYCDSKSKGNHWCWIDILSDFVGMIIGTFIRVILIKLIFGDWRYMWY